MVDVLICDLRDVNKAVNTGDYCCECAESCKADDFGINNSTNGIISLENFPGIILCLFVAERNLFILFIKSLDMNFDFLTNRKNV